MVKLFICNDYRFTTVLKQVHYMDNRNSERETSVSIVAAIVFILLWFALMRWVLPYFGIYT